MTAPAVTREPRDDMLLGLLAEWLRGRRWFPAKGVAADLSCVGGLTLVDPLDEADVRILLVRTAAPGVDTVLQVPLTLRATGGDHAERTIGVLGLDEPSTQDAVVAGARTDVLDGAGDPAFLRAWLAAAQGPGAEVDPARAQVLTGEQSNTSVLLPGSGQAGAGSAIIKVFRALAPGANPDVDVPRALADEGWENVPRPLAWLEATWPSGTSTVTGHLGVVSEFVPGARDGFELACAMAGRGEPFADLARELGEVVRHHRPDAGAVEEVFVNANPQSTLKLGQARGVCLLVLARAGLPVSEYATRFVKKALVGTGGAEKAQVQAMLRVLLPGVKLAGADAADALAVAIAHAHGAR